MHLSQVLNVVYGKLSSVKKCYLVFLLTRNWLFNGSAIITLQLSLTALRHCEMTTYSERRTSLVLFIFHGVFRWIENSTFSLFLSNQHTPPSLSKLCYVPKQITEKWRAFRFYFISNKQPYAKNMDDVLSRKVPFFSLKHRTRWTLKVLFTEPERKQLSVR